jgi:hypothetical protein
MQMSAVQKIEPRQEIASAQPVTPMEMLATAIDKGMAIETIDKLVALAERWDRNTARKAFDEAIAAAKAAIPPIIKNREVDFTSAKGRTHYRHEDMAEIARTVDPILAKHGLSYRYRVTSNVNEPVSVTCILSHRQGHYEETTLHGGRDETGNKNSLQGIGSTITYLQRYSLKAALGLSVTADDDGRAGGKVGGSDEAITDEQVDELRELLKKTGGNEMRFLKSIKLESLTEIRADKFEKAKTLISARAPQP